MRLRLRAKEPVKMCDPNECGFHQNFSKLFRNDIKRGTNIEYFKNLRDQDSSKTLQGFRSEELKEKFPEFEMTEITHNSRYGVAGAKPKDDTSTGMRNNGNSCFQDKKYSTALWLYNQSICYAEPNTLELAQAYSNRAKLLNVKKHYKECLQDIERALAITVYPEASKKALTTLKKTALKKLKETKTFQYHLPAPSVVKPIPSNPAVAKCLEARENEEWGRHVVARRDIKPGEVLLVEDPYILTVNHPKMPHVINDTHCTECTEFCFNMIPCDDCHIAMFCSEECKAKAYAAYHKYECALVQEETTIPEYLYIRMTLKSITERASSGTDTFSYEFKRIADIKVVDEQNQNDKSAKNLISDVCDWLISKTDINKIIGLNKAKSATFLKTLMYHNYLICRGNVFKIVKSHPKTFFYFIGRGFYEFFSKFNHSCIGNVKYTFYGKKLVVRALHKISKGEQCFASYDLICPYIMTLENRKKNLKDSFGFTCKCKACIQNWPLGSSLQSIESETEYPEFVKYFHKIAVMMNVVLGARNEINNTDTLKDILGGRVPDEFKNCTVKDKSGQFHPVLRNILLADAFEVAEKLKDFQPCEDYFFLLYHALVDFLGSNSEVRL